MNKELANKLGAVQRELKVPKSNYNSFGKYKYRSLEDILESLKPLLDKHGLVLYLNDDIEMFGNRVYIKATATISDGQSQECVTAYAREADSKKGMDESQITGTASSYARKYALNGLFCIDDAKDADTDAYTLNQQVPEQVHESKAPTKESVRAEVLQFAQSKGYTPAQLAKKYKLNADSTVQQLADVLEDLRQEA